jgi:hypothetical protein
MTENTMAHKTYYLRLLLRKSFVYILFASVPKPVCEIPDYYVLEKKYQIIHPSAR